MRNPTDFDYMFKTTHYWFYFQWPQKMEQLTSTTTTTKMELTMLPQLDEFMAQPLVLGECLFSS